MEKIQKILNIGLDKYKEKNKIIGYKQKVIGAIKDCKTDNMGAHKYVCDECGYEEIAYNSCRNRHCPNCQTGKKLKWIEARKEEDFFIPVKVLSKKFRGKFLDYLRKAKLEFYGENKDLENSANFDNLIQKMYSKEWVVYCKKPFNNANCVIEYLGRYTHRVAISNERILEVTDNTVKFKWRDYKDNNKMKEMTISIEEFIRRFLLHILPPHFMKIRYYGILGNKNKKKKLHKCKILTRTRAPNSRITKANLRKGL